MSVLFSSRLVNESLERVEKDQLAMAAAKMRKPTPTGSLALGSPPGLQPLIEGKEEGEEEEEGGETTSDPFDVSGRGPIYVLPWSCSPTLSKTQPQYSYILCCSLRTRPSKNWKGGSGTLARVKVYTAPGMKVHF